MFARRRSWDRYLAAAQGAGSAPAPAAKEKEIQERRQASQAGRFLRAAARAGMAAARSAAGLAEFAIWLGLNVAIAVAVIAAAQAAGAHLPHWLVDLADWVQAALGYLAALVLR